MQYYNVRDTMREVPTADTFFIVGQGGVGKSYSVKTLIIEDFLKEKRKSVYVKRWTTEITGDMLFNIFEDVVEDPEVKEWFEVYYRKSSEYFRMHILPKGTWFYIVGETDDGELKYIEKCCKVVAVSKASAFKGGIYNDCQNIFFDEFITENGYYRKDKEPEEMAKIVGTVKRKGVNDNVRVFFAGNPDAIIELNPYLSDLNLNYEKMDANTVYKYDLVEPNGHIIADKIVFIKIANYNGQTFVNASGIGGKEERARLLGEVKSSDFIKLNYRDKFKPEYELIVETPIHTDKEYYKKIYVYYGIIWSEPVCVISDIREYRECESIYCRYDRTDFRPRAIKQTYRINIPAEEGFAGIRAYMRAVDINQLFIADNNQAGTMFEQLRES